MRRALALHAATIARLPEMFDKLAGTGRSDKGTRHEPGNTARDLVMTFQDACGRRDFVQAARCLNLDEIHCGSR